MPRVFCIINTISIGLLVAVLGLAFVGCNQSSSTSQSNQSEPTSTPQETSDPTPQSKLRLDNDNWDLALNEAYGAQEAYLGSNVDIKGKVAQVVTTSDVQSHFTIETEVETTVGRRTLVVVGTDPKLTEGEWVLVQGELDSYWNTQNLMGTEIRMPVVAVYRGIDSVLPITRSEVFPSIRKVSVGESITRHGLTITLQKLEIADSETRLYVHVKNNSPNKASLYAYDAVLVQGTRQVKRRDLFGQDMEEPDTTLVSGTETEGILLFEPISPDVSPVKLIWEGARTDDYLLTFDDWEWVISW